MEIDYNAPASALTIVQATPGRVLNVAFQPNPDYPAVCQYTLDLSCITALLVSQSATVELRSGAANPPTTVRETLELQIQSAPVGVVGTEVSMRDVLTYLCPPGHFVLLATSLDGGTADLVRSVETVLQHG